jgi:hypothetical protein
MLQVAGILIPNVLKEYAAFIFKCLEDPEECANKMKRYIPSKFQEPTTLLMSITAQKK